MSVCLSHATNYFWNIPEKSRWTICFWRPTRDLITIGSQFTLKQVSNNRWSYRCLVDCPEGSIRACQKNRCLVGGHYFIFRVKQVLWLGESKCVLKRHGFVGRAIPSTEHDIGPLPVFEVISWWSSENSHLANWLNYYNYTAFYSLFIPKWDLSWAVGWQNCSVFLPAILARRQRNCIHDPWRFGVAANTRSDGQRSA